MINVETRRITAGRNEIESCAFGNRHAARSVVVVGVVHVKRISPHVVIRRRRRDRRLAAGEGDSGIVHRIGRDSERNHVKTVLVRRFGRNVRFVGRECHPALGFGKPERIIESVPVNPGFFISVNCRGTRNVNVR